MIKSELLRSSSLDQLFNTVVAFEEKSLAKTTRKGFLKGITPSKIKNIATTVPIQKDCISCIHKFMSICTPVHITSTNWSSHLIQEVLDFNNIPTQKIKIFSNNLECDTNGISTGSIIPRCISAQHKCQYLRQNIITPTIYIGDSESDLLALLEADIGILLCPSSLCKEIVDHFRLNVVPIECLKEGKWDPTCIYLTNSWTVIHNVLFLEE